MKTFGDKIDNLQFQVNQICAENEEMKRNFNDQKEKNDKIFKIIYETLPPEKIREIEDILQKK